MVTGFEYYPNEALIKHGALLTLGTVRVIVVSLEVATRRKYRLNRNDHVNSFGMYNVHSLVQCSTHVILTYGCWSLSASLSRVA